MSRRLVATGPAALLRAREILPILHPVIGRTGIGQEYRIPPGTIDRGGDIILGAIGGETYWLHDLELSALGTGTFLHNYQIYRITGDVLERTRWITPAAKIVMAFAMGIASGAFGAAAVVASVGVFVSKVGVFYLNHEQECDLAIAELGTAVEILDWIHRHCPKTWELLARVAREAAWQALVSVPEGLDAADAAAVFGRFLGGLGAAPEAGLGPLLRLLGACAGTFATRLPGAIGRGVAARARAAGEQFVRALREAGVPVTEAEAAIVYLEFQQNPGVPDRLVRLKQALERAAPVIQRLSAAFRGEDSPR